MPFTRISHLLNKSLQKKGLAFQVEATLTCEKFEKIVKEIWGSKLKDKVRAMYLKDKTLTIACLHSVIASEIKLKEKEIIDRINEGFGKEVVKDLRFMI